MTQARHTRHLPLALTAITACLLLTACNDSTAPTSTTTAAPAARTTAGAALPARDALPDCARIATALGNVLSGWQLDDESAPWENPGQSGHGIDCIWWSPRMQSDQAFDKLQGAGIMVRINATPDMETADDVRAIGWAIDDAGVETLGGYLTYPSGQMDFAAPLGPIPPAVVVGKVSVSVARAGAMVVNHTDEGGAFTHRDAVDAAVAVHRLIGD